MGSQHGIARVADLGFVVVGERTMAFSDLLSKLSLKDH
ncbi:MAG: hypothetical protein ACJAZO_000896 [Myxococcota bacterium]|jgi:hypothetical protein